MDEALATLRAQAATAERTLKVPTDETTEGCNAARAAQCAAVLWGDAYEHALALTRRAQQRVRVVVVGSPGAGKSSFVNALVHGSSRWEEDEEKEPEERWPQAAGTGARHVTEFCTVLACGDGAAYGVERLFFADAVERAKEAHVADRVRQKQAPLFGAPGGGADATLTDRLRAIEAAVRADPAEAAAAERLAQEVRETVQTERTKTFETAASARAWLRADEAHKREAPGWSAALFGYRLTGPWAGLPRGVEIVDTPGLDCSAPQTERVETALRGEARAADAVVMISSRFAGVAAVDFVLRCTLARGDRTVLVPTYHDDVYLPDADYDKMYAGRYRAIFQNAGMRFPAHLDADLQYAVFPHTAIRKTAPMAAWTAVLAKVVENRRAERTEYACLAAHVLQQATAPLAQHTVVDIFRVAKDAARAYVSAFVTKEPAAARDAANVPLGTCIDAAIEAAVPEHCVWLARAWRRMRRRAMVLLRTEPDRPVRPVTSIFEEEVAVARLAQIRDARLLPAFPAGAGDPFRAFLNHDGDVRDAAIDRAASITDFSTTARNAYDAEVTTDAEERDEVLMRMDASAKAVDAARDFCRFFSYVTTDRFDGDAPLREQNCTAATPVAVKDCNAFARDAFFYFCDFAPFIPREWNGKTIKRRVRARLAAFGAANAQGIILGSASAHLDAMSAAEEIQEPERKRGRVSGAGSS
jgi:hypothetical protein